MGSLADKRIKNGLHPYEHPKSVFEMLQGNRVFRGAVLWCANRKWQTQNQLQVIANSVWGSSTRLPAVKSYLRKELRAKRNTPMGSADLEYYLRGIQDRLRLSEKLGLPSELERAMDVVTKALRSDPYYFLAWQANIAVEFQDEFARCKKRGRLSSVDVHAISNTAASNFLRRFSFATVADVMEHDGSEKHISEVTTP